MTTQNQSNSEQPTGEDGNLELKRAVARLKEQVEDQKLRIEALARGREESMTIVSQLRTELDLVAAERDQLRKQLTQLEAMQTDTLNFEESEISDDTDADQSELPSIDDLMSSLGGAHRQSAPSHSTLPVESGAAGYTGEYQEMISPDLIVFGSTAKPGQAAEDRFLALLEPGNRKKFSLNGDLLTVGRSESADIPVDADYISRIHSRVLRIGMDSVIEDAGSRNGTWINGERIDRHVLRHGDLVRIGSAHFRYIDAAAGDSDLE